MVGVIGALAVAQSLGHLTLLVSAAHHHGDTLGVTPSMAAAILGVAINSVADLYVVRVGAVLAATVRDGCLEAAARLLPLPASDVVAQSMLRCCDAPASVCAPPRRAALAAQRSNSSHTTPRRMSGSPVGALAQIAVSLRPATLLFSASVHRTRFAATDFETIPPSAVAENGETLHGSYTVVNAWPRKLSEQRTRYLNQFTGRTITNATAEHEGALSR